MLGPANWGFKRITFTGTQTKTIANHFDGVAFTSTDQFLVFVESGMGRIVANGDITATTIRVTNDSSPSSDTNVIVVPLVARN